MRRKGWWTLYRRLGLQSSPALAAPWEEALLGCWEGRSQGAYPPAYPGTLKAASASPKTSPQPPDVLQPLDCLRR